jgi:hypothetical protein
VLEPLLKNTGQAAVCGSFMLGKSLIACMVIYAGGMSLLWQASAGKGTDILITVLILKAGAHSGVSEPPSAAL